MTRKTNTIIFVPHARAKFRQFHVSSRLLIGLGVSFLLSILIGGTFTTLWVYSFRRNREMNVLAEENRNLRGRTSLLNGRLETIEKQLTEFEERTRRLALVAGLTGIHDSGTGGVGGLTSVAADPAASSENGVVEALRRGTVLSSRLALIERRLSTQADQLSLTPTLAPTVGVLTAGFGNRVDPFNGKPEFHTGIDISTPSGNRIVSPANGTIVKVGWENGYGRFVEIAHGYGVNTTYGHLATARVVEGQRVKRGDVIALVGSTGRSTGPHLHYEVRSGGKAVNPLDFILNAF
jgi:murein DD-endopeptidase MepM/ murein hydrolase activator NlpD